MSLDFEGARARHPIADIVGRTVTLEKDGTEFRGLCPFHNEKTPSFTVKPSAGFYHCFGCGVHGDVVDFVAHMNRVTAAEAIRILDGDRAAPKVTKAAIAARAEAEPSIYAALQPGRTHADIPTPGKTFVTYNPKRQRFGRYKPVLVHVYDKASIVIRAEIDGKKLTPMLRWAHVDSGDGVVDVWAHWPFDEPRRLYVRKPAEAASPQVFVVEGEKAADALFRILGNVTVVTWAGGTNAVHKTDWSPLSGRSVVLWPDNDAPGVKAMGAVAELLSGKAKAVKVIAPDETKPAGWDAADAEADGWDRTKLLTWAAGRAKGAASAQAVNTPPPSSTRIDAGVSASSSDGRVANPPTDEHPAVAPFPFRILGHDDGRYYYFPSGSQQVVRFSAAAHTASNLLSLYPNPAWWQERYPQKAKGFNLDDALSELLRRSHEVGIFDDNRVRGRGAWTDGGRAVIHLGDDVLVDSVRTAPHAIPGRHIYAALPRVEFHTVAAATTAEANKLAKLCERFSWTQPLSGTLLCGWLVSSMVCGMLKWRPHIWITGGAGSGKTTVVNEVVARMIGPLVERCDGTITEAGIRQHMRHDARPVLIDEFESEGKTDSERVQAVLKLIRLSSSGSSVKRGSGTGEGVEYIVRSSFCLSSINTAAGERADQSRISKLVLEPMPPETSEDHFVALMRDIEATLTPEYAAAMFYRTVAHSTTLLKNIDTFTKAASAVLQDRRAADQVAAMVAGFYLCHSTKLVDLDAATTWLRARSWGSYTAIESATDEVKLVRKIALIPLRVTSTRGAKDISVGELIQVASGKESDVQQAEARAALGRIGIAIVPGCFVVANQSPTLKRLLEGTPWSHDWVRPLRSTEGAEAAPNTYFSPGFKERGTRLPLSILSDTPTPSDFGDYDGTSDLFE